MLKFLCRFERFGVVVLIWFLSVNVKFRNLILICESVYCIVLCFVDLSLLRLCVIDFVRKIIIVRYVMVVLKKISCVV